jgi:hypothetical protein
MGLATRRKNVVKIRVLFETLGFQEDWEVITDQRPATTIISAIFG